MELFMNGVLSLVQQYQTLVWILAVASLLACGVMIAVPFDSIKEKGKKALGGVFLGVGIALCALALASDFTSAWGF